MSMQDMYDDLKRSGLTAAHLKKLQPKIQLKYKTATQLKKELDNSINAEAYAIPYFTLEGKLSGYVRYRILKAVPFKVKKLGKTVEQVNKDLPKYTQKKGTTPEAYFPPVIKWKDVAKDKTQRIVITEGEKKALVACLYGLPTIGLGGVYSFRSKAKRISFTKELEKIEWQDRDVTIMYDSDFSTNDDVRRAMYMLADELVSRGALIDLAYVPEGPNGEKQGIDDYLLLDGADTETLLNEANYEDYNLSRELFKMRDEVILVRDLDMYYKVSTGKLIDSKKMIDTAYANRKVVVYDGENPRVVKVAKEYNEWPYRREVNKIVYEPQPVWKDRTLITEDNNINIWEGWPVAPEKGSVKPYKDLLNYLFDPKEKDGKKIRDWVEKWIAYPIQYPGTLMVPALVLWSRYKGNGKSSLGEMIKNLYGVNGWLGEEKHLKDERRAWMKAKQFVAIEETAAQDDHRAKKAAHAAFKVLRTSKTINIDEKYKAPYDIANIINIYISSNHPDVLPVEEGERRATIWNVDKPTHPDGTKFYDPIIKWFNSKEGIAALLYYFAYEVDLSDFDPNAPGLETVALQNMIDLHKSSEAAWAADLIEADTIMMNGHITNRDLFTISELEQHCKTLTDKNGLDIRSIKSALSEHGAIQLDQRSDTVYTRKARLWAVRNIEKWKKAKPSQINKHVNDTFVTNVVTLNKGGKQ